MQIMAWASSQAADLDKLHVGGKVGPAEALPCEIRQQRRHDAKDHRQPEGWPGCQLHGTHHSRG